MTPTERKSALARKARKTRLLPSKGGVACLIHAIESSRDEDYIVIALSSEDLKVAEYTHCETAEQAATVLVRYHRMPEVAEAFVLHRFGADFDMRQKLRDFVDRWEQ